MKGFTVLSAILLHACVSYGYPGSSEGVGAFAYQDTTGNRYGGTYGLRDGQVVNVKGDYPPPEFLAPPQWGTIQNIPDVDNFFPEYFKNFEYLIQHIRIRRAFGFPRHPFRRFRKRAFGSSFRNQNLALNAARKAYDLTSNKVGTYSPPFDFRFPSFDTLSSRHGGPSAFDMSQNSAFAGAAAGPGFSHHFDAINPENPQMPNVEVTKSFSTPNNGGYYSVSSSSYSSSSNIDGEVKNQRGAETTVNNNGKVTHYKVHN